MAQDELLLMAHLMRRAGFGADLETLKAQLSDGYEQTVDSLLAYNGKDQASPMTEALVRRYHPNQSATHDEWSAGSYWLYRLAVTGQPLREKIALFWHNIFATGYSKVTNGKPLTHQIDMFRSHGMGRFDQLLLRLSRDPAMIIWLDNIDNHRDAINENYGRELLELFSMGVGNYTEADIRACSRAFTGWTVENADYTKQLATRDSIWPYGKLAWRFEYNENDHDAGPKTFMGQTGRFNGEDIIDIICQQPATAKFIARHLYHFFVADEPPVPQWPYKAPGDPKALAVLEKEYFDSKYNIGAMLRLLFNSEFFKSEGCQYKKIKSPAELVAGVLRITREFDSPKAEIMARNDQTSYMGQTLLNPPTVEGWHQGTEWINTGSLAERVNFISQQLGNTQSAGAKSLIKNILDCSDPYMTAEECVDKCLGELGALQVSRFNRDILVECIDNIGLPKTNLINDREAAERKIATILSVVGIVPEFQRS